MKTKSSFRGKISEIVVTIAIQNMDVCVCVFIVVDVV